MHEQDTYTDRSHLATTAALHLADMSRQYAEDIAASAKHAVIYDEKTFPNNIVGIGKKPRISVVGLDSPSTVFNYSSKQRRVAVVDAASYKAPGSDYLRGGLGQEESLCRASTLFNVLQTKPDYYKENCSRMRSELYSNRALYLPDIKFDDGNRKASCDVIVCSPPNRAGIDMQSPMYKENHRVLKRRIRFILDIAQIKEIDVLIIPAFGCGSFKQDPTLVAELFKQVLSEKNYSIRDIIFSIPERDNDTLSIFKKEFMY